MFLREKTAIPYTGYGTQEQLRILARVVLRPPKRTQLFEAAEAFLHRRQGWRKFFSAPAVKAPVRLVVGDEQLDRDRPRRLPRHPDQEPRSPPAGKLFN